MELYRIDTFLEEKQDYLQNVCIDNVIFGYHDRELKVLLQQPFEKGKWTVSGGYIRKTETIEEAAKRIAYLRTGLKDLYFQQFGSFGSPGRVKDKTFTVKRISESLGVELPPDYWIFDYFVTVGYYTLTEFSTVSFKKAHNEADCRWWPVHELPPTMFDHSILVSEALRALRLHIAHYPIGYELLPEKFTLPEIHNLYQAILGKPLDSRNFTKRLLATGIVEKLDETRSIGPHRSPFLYKFNKRVYNAGLKDGVLLAF